MQKGHMSTFHKLFGRDKQFSIYGKKLKNSYYKDML